ncbi:ADENINE PHOSPHORIBOSYLTRANSFERASE [Salix viminalis]|uniref:ADENINE PHOSPHORIBOSYLTRANSFERASE n=1 Tax=Salix viminalis TaxID=40686 RepID=A0A9Q0Z888_SALVM|nr:ADENINE PHOSPHORIBOSYLTRANSFERASE [Salix viminalis]
MAKTKPQLPTTILLLLFLLLTTTITTTAFSFSRSYSQYKTLFSLSHSLLTRVSNLRASRGDISGSNRAKLIAQKLERGLGFGELYGAVSEMNELLRFLGELTRSGSEAGRATWIAGNYKNVLRVSQSVLRRLVKVFHQSGPLKETVEIVQREVAEGDLLSDCLELGGNDLKGLVQIVKDLASQFYSSSSSSTSQDDYNSDL